jgi:nicotinamidase-related amidase
MTPNSIARRNDAALVVIDDQERLASAMERREQVLKATIRLVRVAALVGMPIIVTRQYPKGLGDTEPALAQAISDAEKSGARVFSADKVTFDCACEPAFVEALSSAGRSQLVLTGMETHICVTQTALSTRASGHDVHVVADACCSRDDENHRIALDRMRHAGAVVTTSESVMYELVGAAGTDEFKALLGIVKE